MDEVDVAEVEEDEVAAGDTFPPQIPRDHEACKRLMPIYDCDGKRLSIPGYGFDVGDDIKVPKGWFAVRSSGNTMICVRVDADEMMGMPIDHLLESENLIEVFQWLVDKHWTTGTEWHKSGYREWVQFSQLICEPKGIEELMPILISRAGRTMLLHEDFDVDEEKQRYEHYELSSCGRTIWALLIPHPMGGDQLVHIWHSDYDQRYRVSFKKPHFKSGGPGVVKKKSLGDMCFERLHTLMRSVTEIVRGYPYVYSVCQTIWVSGCDYPKKFDQLREAMLFAKDHKGWGKASKKLRPEIRKLLESLENRMAIRRDPRVKVAEKFLCKMVNMKLKPVREKRSVVPSAPTPA